MKKRELLKQLNNLKNIKPDSNWQKLNREILLTQLKAQTSKDFEFGKAKLWSRSLAKSIFVSAYKPVMSMAIVLILILGTWIATVSATKNSLPGDFFYGIKLATERVQSNLAGNDEKRANLEITFAERRLAEMQKVAGKDNTQNQKENLKVSLRQFQENINNIKSSLAKLENTNSKLAAKVADLVDKKTKEYVDILKDQKGKAPELASNTDEAISVSKATGDKALGFILNEFESGKGDLNLDQVKSKINDRIENLENDLALAKTEIDRIIVNKKIADEKAKADAEAKAQAEKAEAEKAAAEAKSETENNTTPEPVKADSQTNANINQAPVADTKIDVTIPDNSASDNQITPEAKPEDQPAEILPTIDEIKDKPEEAARFLAKAQDFLKNNSVSQAFDAVKQADDILTLVNKVINANNQYLINGEGDKGVENNNLDSTAILNDKKSSS